MIRRSALQWFSKAGPLFLMSSLNVSVNALSSQAICYATTSKHSEEMFFGGDDDEWDALLASSSIEIVRQRLTPDEKVRQARTDEFIDKLLSVRSNQLVKDMIFSAVCTNKSLQEKHLVEMVKRARKQFVELHNQVGPGGVVSASSVAVYPPTRASLILEAALEAGFSRMLCEKEGGKSESTINSETTAPPPKSDEMSGLSPEEEALFAMLLARKHAAQGTTAPAAIPSEHDVDEELTKKREVLQRVSKIADGVLKLLLYHGIKNIQDLPTDGTNTKVADPSTATTPQFKQQPEDSAEAWRLLALMERKGLRVISPKIVEALRDHTSCGLESLSTQEDAKQQHVVVAQRNQFLDREGRRIQHELKRSLPDTAVEMGQNPHYRQTSPEAISHKK